MSRNLEIGIVLSASRNPLELGALARHAERAGIKHFWLSSLTDMKDQFLGLGVAATMTRRIRLGPIAVSPFEMHPARIGVSLLTLAELSKGRSTIVLGGGGEFASTLGPTTNQVDMVSETVDIVRLINHGGRVNYHGKFFQIRNLYTDWNQQYSPPLIVGANRPRMIEMAARKADGVMVTDMPLPYVKTLIQKIRTSLRKSDRPKRPFKILNWFLWNVQETRRKAVKIAETSLGFRLYYIRDIAASIGLDEAMGERLEAHRLAMIRARYEGRRPWLPPKYVRDLLVEQLTITGEPEDLDQFVERLFQFSKAGVDQVALALTSQTPSAIRLLARKVISRIPS